jgi:hypothetical protein
MINFSVIRLWAQEEDSVQQLLAKVLYSKKVYSYVFFDYVGIGESPHVLAPGKYSFIFPDSTFKRFYPEIEDDLSITWATEKKLYTKTYLRNIESGTVYIKSNINSDPNLKFYLTFNNIEMFETKAHVSFVTSCNRIDYQDGAIFMFDVHLTKRHGIWELRQVKMLRDDGCR